MSAQEEDSPETTNLHSTALADPGESTPPPHKDTCTLLLTIWSSSPHLARGAPICVGVSALENSFPDLLAQQQWQISLSSWVARGLGKTENTTGYSWGLERIWSTISFK